MKNKFLIAWGVNNQTDYTDACWITATDEGDAFEEAFQQALLEVDSYGGLHGYPTSGNQDCEECEGENPDCETCQGVGSFEKPWDEFCEEASSWISYTALEYGKQDEEIIKFLDEWFDNSMPELLPKNVMKTEA